MSYYYHYRFVWIPDRDYDEVFLGFAQMWLRADETHPKRDQIRAAVLAAAHRLTEVVDDENGDPVDLFRDQWVDVLVAYKIALRRDFPLSHTEQKCRRWGNRTHEQVKSRLRRLWQTVDVGSWDDFEAELASYSQEQENVIPRRIQRPTAPKSQETTDMISKEEVVKLIKEAHDESLQLITQVMDTYDESEEKMKKRIDTLERRIEELERRPTDGTQPKTPVNGKFKDPERLASLRHRLKEQVNG